jgi:hypothetical protein
MVQERMKLTRDATGFHQEGLGEYRLVKPLEKYEWKN